MTKRTEESSAFNRLLGQPPRIRSMNAVLFDPMWAQCEHASEINELLFPLKGQVELQIGDSKWRAGSGDILMVPSGTLHRDQFDLLAGLEAFMVHFEWQAAREYFNRVDNHLLQALSGPVKQQIREILEQMFLDTKTPTPIADRLAEARLLTVLLLPLNTIRQKTGTGEKAQTFGKRRRQQLVRRAKRFLEEHCGEIISIQTLAGTLGVSGSHLSHVFRMESDFSPITYLTTLRMNKARELLAQGERSVAEVAYAVGYTDGNYFSKAFRKFFGCPPRDCRATRS